MAALDLNGDLGKVLAGLESTHRPSARMHPQVRRGRMGRTYWRSDRHTRILMPHDDAVLMGRVRPPRRHTDGAIAPRCLEIPARD